MNQKEESQPIYMEKLGNLINYLKEKDTPNRDDVLEVIRLGGDEVTAMLESFGAGEWSEVVLNPWEPEEISAIQKDWRVLVDHKETAVFWTWLDPETFDPQV
jgi:hypothetical protein